MKIFLFFLLFISLSNAIRCIFTPYQSYDFTIKRNWDNKTHCPCNGTDCIIDLSQEYEGMIITKVSGTFGEVLLPKRRLLLEIEGEVLREKSLTIYHELTLLGNPIYYNTTTDIQLNDVYVYPDPYASLILSTPFKILYLVCENQVIIKGNGYIESIFLIGSLTIQENKILTINHFESATSNINLNGFLVVNDHLSYIKSSTISLGFFTHTVYKMTIINNIILQEVQFNLTEFNEEYCDNDPIILVHSINGKIRQDQISFLYDETQYKLDKSKSEQNIQVILNSISCRSEYYFFILIFVGIILLLFCIVFMILLLIKMYGKLHIKKD